MSGPRNDGDDAFDDFFGDPTPSGRMGPAPTGPSGASFADHPDDEPTQDVELRRRDEATQAMRREPVITPEPTPQGAVPEGWWEPDPEPAQASATPSATWSATPAPHQQPAVQHESPRRGLSPLAMVAVLVGGVLLGALCVGGAVMATSDDDTPVAQSKTVTETTSPQETTTSTSPPSTSSTSTSTSSSTSSARRSGKAPSGVTECAGPRAGVAVGRGTEVTSCAFAGAVRDAYVSEKPKGGNASLEVRSPVTDKSYTMTCTGAVVTRCTGGNNAVVVLY